MILPKLTLQTLFTTSRVVTAVYRIVSTAMLLTYIARRAAQGRRYSGRRDDYQDGRPYRRDS